MSDEKPIEEQVLVTISGGGMPQVESAIGILKALKVKRFLNADKMMGTSAGAIVSSLYMSKNQSITELENIVRNSVPRDWFKIRPWQAIKSVVGLSNYVADNTAFKLFLLENINKNSIDNVKVGVTDMGKVGGDNKPHGTKLLDGRASHVLASMSFQNVFPPCSWDGELYADGGVFNNCPLPTFMELQRYKHVYVILAADEQILPKVKGWPFMDRIFNLIDCTMNREFSQIRELKLDEAPNITVFQPEKFVDSASFLGWSDGFEQIQASYEYALKVLEEEDQKGKGL